MLMIFVCDSQVHLIRHGTRRSIIRTKESEGESFSQRNFRLHGSGVMGY